ncbi:CCR4-NOT transcription complex subunit 3 isoform X2 [Agrilus planipennis]|uniref:CCR4-NOT transcription complex subunit 3 n=1 Tax=Agrilus planipennis TaxID=224129 RepID=A0A1W4WZD7_AGRPL|nr:CCR4-NOT transcription complex subunit 3 isoform X2 [Agrilus planipennis]
MAATRKLQGEIDRCLKKVTEGVETFEDIWQKVHNATNNNQKEKYEADLKKEIKKLQRLRDQIKSWIASGEIKDKSTLMDYRKLIETQMERFKVVERETKTKAYSKEGLGAAQKLDPAQKEREEISNWLVMCIDQLNIQIDSFECEIESLLANKKKKLDKDKQERMDELKAKLEKHRFHIRKLETLLRMLDNMSVEVSQIKQIKDDVEYYVDSSQDPDFEENVYLYDDIIGLDEVELSGVGLPSSATTDSNETGGTPTSTISGSSPIASPSLSNPPYNHSSDSSNEDKKNQYKEAPKPVKPMAVRAASSTITATCNLNSSSNSTLSSSGNSTTSTPNSKTTLHTSVAVPNSKNPLRENSPILQQPQQQLQQLQQQNVAPVTVAPSNTGGGSGGSTTGNFAAIAAAGSNANLSKINTSSTTDSVQSTVITSSNSISQTSTISAPSISPAMTTVIHHAPLASIATSNPPSGHVQTVVVNSTQKQPNTFTEHNNQNSVSPVSSVSSRTSPLSNSDCNVQITTGGQPVLNGPLIAENKVTDGMSTLKTIAQQVIDRAGLDGSSSNGNNTSVVLDASKQTSVGGGGVVTNASAGKSEAHIPPLLGVAPLGAVPLQKEHQQQFQMMESAYYHMPHPSDSERTRTYLPRNPIHTPPYYIQQPLPHSDTLEFYQRLATETLFFVFYYMEGTKAQYLAAKALKKQSWRFHTKYMMWFQRHEEPKIINEEYEQGTYIYFDYEKWGQRKKEGFTFEYKYLEDRDLN